MKFPVLSTWSRDYSFTLSATALCVLSSEQNWKVQPLARYLVSSEYISHPLSLVSANRLNQVFITWNSHNLVRCNRVGESVATLV